MTNWPSKQFRKRSTKDTSESTLLPQASWQWVLTNLEKFSSPISLLKKGPGFYLYWFNYEVEHLFRYLLAIGISCHKNVTLWLIFSYWLFATLSLVDYIIKLKILAHSLIGASSPFPTFYFHFTLCMACSSFRRI